MSPDFLIPALVESHVTRWPPTGRSARLPAADTCSQRGRSASLVTKWQSLMSVVSVKSQHSITLFKLKKVISFCLGIVRKGKNLRMRGCWRASQSTGKIKVFVHKTCPRWGWTVGASLQSHIICAFGFYRRDFGFPFLGGILLWRDHC